MKKILIKQFSILINLLYKLIDITEDKDYKLAYFFRIKNYNNFIRELNFFNKNDINEFDLSKLNIGFNVYLKAKYIIDNPDKILPAIRRLYRQINKLSKYKSSVIRSIYKIIGSTADKIDIKLKDFKKYNITSVKQLINLLESNKINITDNKKLLVGLKLKSQYSISIPYTEVSLIENFLKNLLYIYDKNIILTICGSYRRHLKYCNDLDVIIKHKKYKSKKEITKSDILNKIIKYLKFCKFIISDNYAPSNKKFEYMGLCNFNKLYSDYSINDLKKINKWVLSKYPNRRIDIIIYPLESYYYGLVYRTGPYVLIRYIREYAYYNGYNYDEYGLYTIKTNKFVKINSEKNFFDKIKMPYIKPENRTYYNIVKKLFVRQKEFIEKIHIVR